MGYPLYYVPLYNVHCNDFVSNFEIKTSTSADGYKFAKKGKKVTETFG